MVPPLKFNALLALLNTCSAPVTVVEPVPLTFRMPEPPGPF